MVKHTPKLLKDNVVFKKVTSSVLVLIQMNLSRGFIKRHDLLIRNGL